MRLKTATALIDAPAAVINFAELMHGQFRQRYAYPMELLTGLERVMWAEDKSGVIGIWLWTAHDHGRRWWVDFAAVAPRALGTGVYRAMRKRFVGLARKDGLCRAFESHVAITNMRMRRLNEEAGSRAVSIKYRYDIK